MVSSLLIPLSLLPTIPGRFLHRPAAGAGWALSEEAEGGPGGTPGPSAGAAGAQGSAAAPLIAVLTGHRELPAPQPRNQHSPWPWAVSAPSPGKAWTKPAAKTSCHPEPTLAHSPARGALYQRGREIGSTSGTWHQHSAAQLELKPLYSYVDLCLLQSPAAWVLC